MAKIEKVRQAFGHYCEHYEGGADVERSKELKDVPLHAYAEERLEVLKEARDLLEGFVAAPGALTGGNLPSDVIRRMGEKERAKGVAWALEARGRAWAKAADVDVVWLGRDELIGTEVRQRVVAKVLRPRLEDIPDQFIWEVVEGIERELGALAFLVIEYERLDWLPFLRKTEEDLTRVSRAAREMTARGQAVMEKADGNRIARRLEKAVDAGLAENEDDLMWSEVDDLHVLGD